VLRAQAAKSTEVVAQLKETDSNSRALVEKVEKQVAEMRAQMEELSIQHRLLQQKVNEAQVMAEGHTTQVTELKKALATKDAACLSANHAQREAEVERDKLQVHVESLEKQVETWKRRAKGNQAEEVTQMRVGPFNSFTCAHHVNVGNSLCCSASFARMPSKIPSSSVVVTSFARIASTTVWLTAFESVPTARYPLEIMIL